MRLRWRAMVLGIVGCVAGMGRVALAQGAGCAGAERLVVIGFMGGRVKGGNLVHREATMAQELEREFPCRVAARVFANHDAGSALRAVLGLLDADGDGVLSAREKAAARIVIYGHSWGASEGVTLAGRLDGLSIPVLLSVQVDSVQKKHEDDERIPPNVREAVNFFQSEGKLHGRSRIRAVDEQRTVILGNYESSYRETPVACEGYPWFARTFMKQHIEIENDPAVWGEIAELIRKEVLSGNAEGL